MNTTTTLQQLHGLRLTGMAKRYKTLLSLPTHQQEDAHTVLALMCQADPKIAQGRETSLSGQSGRDYL